jgi:site-specific recombinase XerD
MIPTLKSLPRTLDSKFVFKNLANPRRGRYYGENFLNELWNKAVKDTGYAPVKLYDATRHSFASQLREAGANLSDIQELLGHSDSRMTERYAHAEQKRLTRIINMRRR